MLPGAVRGPGARGEGQTRGINMGPGWGAWVGRLGGAPGWGGVSSSSCVEMRGAAQLKRGQGGPRALGPARTPLRGTTCQG